MKLACLLFFVLFAILSHAFGQVYQRADVAEAVRDTMITAFEENNDSTVYTAMQKIIDGLQPVSYLSPLLLRFAPRERILPLRFGEGQNGYYLEGWVDQSFVLLQGRSQMDHFAQTSRVSLRYAPALRMTRDNSKNLLPPNQKIGIQVDKVIWDSYTRNFLTDRRHERFEYADDNSWLRSPHDLHMFHATLNAMHFSNGQGEGVYASGPDSIAARNDYLKGDFSTNFVNLTFTYDYYNEYLITAALGYQYDGDWGGPFAFIDEQRRRYGRSRLKGFFQVRSRPVPNLLRRYFTVKDIYHQRSYQVKRLWEHRLQLDVEYILGPLDRFRRSRDYRFSTHFFYELSPLRSRTIGFIAHLFYGRDYLNIRYDDIVLAGMIGLSFTLNKYRHPRFNPNSFIVKEVGSAKFETIRKANKARRLHY